MAEPTKPTFGDLFDRAKKGTDEDWDFIDKNLGPEHLIKERVVWAILRGLINTNSDVRDFAATVIARSDVPVSKTDQIWLVGPMTQDSNVAVRHWLANALYKRGNRDSEVVAVWEEACKAKTPAGEFARKLKTA